MLLRRLIVLALFSASAPLFADSTPQTIPLNQNWSNIGMITVDDDWSGVPGFVGHRGDNLTTSIGVDPQTLLADGTNTPIDINANRLPSEVNTFLSGGLSEFELTDPTVAMQGSGTADAPFLLLNLNATGRSALRVRYKLRDLDSSIDDSIQPFALHYRVGTSGAWTNVSAGFVADASSGPSLATLETLVDVTLPSAVDGQPVVQIRVMTTNALGNEELVGVDDFQITDVAGTVDVPPTVASTIPAANAVGVLLDANITVNFSESVTLGTNWYTLQCALSGAVTGLTLQNTASSYTLNPTPVFAPSELCTFTVLASQVNDTDGTINAMVANYVTTFTTVTDDLPVVSSTSPANNANNAASATNITVVFSEAVDVTDWIDLSCGAPLVAVPGTTSGSGSSTIVFDPTANLAAGSSCSALIKRSGILDRDGTPNQPAADVTIAFTVTSGGGGYYASVDPLNATTLRSTVHQLIRAHACYPYSGPTNAANAWTILELADQDPTLPASAGRILDVYKNVSYLKITDRSNGMGGATLRYNREHTWPNSYGFNNRLTAGTVGANSVQVPNCPYTDTHMLYLSNEDYNSQRGNKAYDNCPTCTELTTANYGGAGGTSGVYPGDSNWSGANAFETWRKRKGDVARAILYMDIRYEGGDVGRAGSVITEPNLIVTDNLSLLQTTPSGQFAATSYMGRLSTLLQWHQQDPPDELECLRNANIQSYQGNRNPFIDNPEWAGVVYQDVVFAANFETKCAL